jgi:DNA-binding CsgD family transcriptional regulator
MPETRIVGRDREMSMLREALERMIQGHGGLVLVSGEAGIGKTALVGQLITEVREQGVLVLSGAAYDLSTTPPYGPWLEVLRRYPAAGESLPALPEFVRDRDALAALQSQEALHEATLAFFMEVAAQIPLMLVLEDIHWSDRPSLELLRFLGRHVVDQRLLLVASYRDDEVLRQHPLYQLTPALVRESMAERVELQALEEAAVAQLVEQKLELEEAERDRLVRILMARSDGNPLFIVELLRTLEADKALEGVGDAVDFDELRSTPVPILIRQMVERRLADLSDDTVDAVRLAAIVGQKVSLERWEQVTEAAVGTVAEEALEAQLLEETPDGEGVTFRHALIREAIYEMVSLPRRRELHRQVAEVYLEDTRPDPEVVAWHLKQSGDPRAADWLIKAGEQAERRFAWHVAVERYLDTVELLRKLPDRHSQLARLLLKIGRMIRFTDPARGVAYHEEAEQLGRQSGDHVIAAFALFNGGNQLCFAGQFELGLPRMQAAVDELISIRQDMGDTARWSQTLLSHDLDPLRTCIGTLVGMYAFAGRYSDALAASERYFEIDWRAESDPERLTHVALESMSFTDGYWGLGVALSTLGHEDDAFVAWSLAGEILRSLDYRSYELLFTSSYLVSHHFPYHTTNLQERRELVSAIEERMSLSSGSIGAQNAYWGYSAYLLHAGRWDELRRLCQEQDPPAAAAFIAVLTGVRARLERYSGDFASAWHLIHAAFPDGPGAGREDEGHFTHRETHRIAAGLALDGGDLDRARTWLHAHDRWLDWSGAVLGRAEGLLLWARLHLVEGDDEAATDCAYQALKQASDPEQPMALIATHRFLGTLATRTGDFDAAADHLQRSRDLVEACALPYERALTMLEQAELAIAKRTDANAQELLVDVKQVLTDLGARPALERAEKLLARISPRRVEEQFGLTRRELDVLRLLERGLSDKAIAEELYISHHTVMHHVSSILRKLDVDSRTAAAAKAVRTGLV